MIDALLRAVLAKVDYDAPHPPDPEQDVECSLWSGLLEFGALPNGSYLAAVPFIDLVLPYGGSATPDLLVYDGLGGFCGAPTPPAMLNLRVTVAGLDSLGNPVLGSALTTTPFPGSNPPHGPAEFSVAVDVENIVRRRRARLWFRFTFRHLC
jgi:hypothetical protein